MITRRQFTVALGTLAAAGMTGGIFRQPQAATTIPMRTDVGYGPLLKDPNGILALPEGFSYQVLSSFGELMSDGMRVPDRADGMGCIALNDSTVALIRNHELQPKHLKEYGPGQPEPLKTALAYDTNSYNEALPGGTTTLIYNTKTGNKEREFVSLTGTIRNCSGGVTPWGSWLTCEESVDTPSGDGKKYHGYVFEIPATAEGLIEAKPLKALGRFNHEAACVDPETGIVYMTEDRGDSLLYRLVPNEYGKLAAGGKLQALAVKGYPKFDTRNWKKREMPLGEWLDVSWVDIESPDSAEDDLRKQGYQLGAALFARGEGIHWTDDRLYFCCTNGGNKKLGQVMAYKPSAYEGTPSESDAPGVLQLFVESSDSQVFNFGDNLTVAPNGHLIVCEDQYTAIVDNHLRGVTPDGEVYPFAQLALQTELAGACFSPDGSTLFVNLYSPTQTLAISGPWKHLRA
ncbi:alkaline phosphatase PhoX [Alteromonas lipolytica]|uniref:Phosphatase n=1 Tax=Alteromonas lipolytica TaxID=1856405 RepID=A0A1E8FHX8_9ALTE|nr:alkaline phosphatase PhoX [Alteromonas lipolytica]OFI35509.1 phosphatase [Alteromonas lipolytica]GGF76837.1 dTDP-glucose 4,6-dehydratase [Alteromonas lipolytica]